MKKKTEVITVHYFDGYEVRKMQELAEQFHEYASNNPDTGKKEKGYGLFHSGNASFDNKEIASMLDFLYRTRMKIQQEREHAIFSAENTVAPENALITSPKEFYTSIADGKSLRLRDLKELQQLLTTETED